MDRIPAPDVQRQLDELLEHLPAGVVVHDADGRIVKANRLATELLRPSTEQLRGKSSGPGIWRFVHADGKPMLPEHFPVNVVLRTLERVTDTIVGIPGDDEQVRWLICNAYPEYEHGRLHQVVVCFTDCTELKRAQQRLEESEERLRLVLRGSTDAPWDWDLTADKIYYSDRWWEMIGYLPGELESGPGLWSALLHPDDQARVAAHMDELLAGRRESYSIEFRLRCRDGHYVPVLSRGFVMLDAQGRPLRISGTNTDLTERKMAERQIYELAYFDHLTGLPNRRLLVEELERTLARSRRAQQFGALIFLDLDNFKLLNDTMGHDIGDRLLQLVAQRLRESVRQGDQLARLGATNSWSCSKDWAMRRPRRSPRPAMCSTS